MRILGIDPGLDTTGYGIIEVQKSSKVKSFSQGSLGIGFSQGGVIKTRAVMPIFQRLNKIYEGITEVVKKFKPDILILEKLYSHYRHPITAILMGHARGVICLVCARNKIPLISYAATRVKKAITGSGNASKHQVKMMVTNLLCLSDPPEYEDTSDALALAIAHLYIDKVKSNDFENLWKIKRKTRR